MSGRRSRVATALGVVVLAVATTTCSSSARSKSSAPATTTTEPLTAPSPTSTTQPATTKAVTTIDVGIKVYGDCHTPTVEPKEIILACADVGALFEGLSWTSWTAKSATATGSFVYNDCTPDCARGHRHSLPTKITLSAPVCDPNGQLVWSLVQSSAKPPGYDPGPQSLPTQPG